MKSEIRIGDCYDLVEGKVKKYLDITLDEDSAKELLEEIDLQVGLPACENPSTILGKLGLALQKIIEEGAGKNV